MQPTTNAPNKVIKTIDAAAYKPQLEGKIAYVKGLFQNCDVPELEVYESQPRGYRMRSEFGVWHEGDDMYFVMHEKADGAEGEEDGAGDVAQPSDAVPGATTAATDAAVGADATGENGNDKKGRKDDKRKKKKKKNEKPASIKVRMDQYPVASELVNRLMVEVRQRVLKQEVLKRKLFQVNFHTTRNEAMVTLIYHKKLDEDWTAQATALRDELREALASGDAAGAGAGVDTLHVIGRSRKQKICLDDDHIVEVYDVKDRGELSYVQVEGAFSQPNSGTCAHMLSWAVSATAGCQDHDLLELYCGNGNFTTAVASNFRNVVATEVSKSSVAAAKKNFERNGVTNVFVARMRSEEFTDGWKNGTDFKRLEGSNLKACDFKTLLVDPPRAGLDDETRLLLKEFERVVYISCNPETLKRDYLSAKAEFDVERFAMFDQFPYTHHVECGLYLRRKKKISEDDGTNKKQKL